MKPFLLTLLLFTLSYCGQIQNSPTEWKSVNRILSFEYANPWSILPTLDTKGKTLTGVIDKRDGKSYVIQITDDVAKGKLSDEAYFDGVKQTMLQANKKNMLIAESDTTFHGMKAHSQSYLMYTQKWGLLKQVSFVIRTGIEFVSVQILFPIIDEGAATKSIPLQLVEFDRTVRLEPK